MTKGYALEEALGLCTKYVQDFMAMRRQVWDDKEDPNMFDGAWMKWMDANHENYYYKMCVQFTNPHSLD